MKRVKKIIFLCSAVLLVLLVNSMVTSQTVNAAVKAPAAPTSVKAASYSYNSIKIQWSGVTGAGGYAVYRATSSTGSFSLITRTTAKYYINTGLVTGKTYYYKVRAYTVSGTKRVYGSYSSKVSAKAVPSAPASAKAASSSYNSINVTWGSVTGASGYSLYRAESSTGSFSLVTRTTARNYINTGLITGKTYYYKIRAYRVSGTKRIYGSYSSIVSAKAVPSVPSSIKVTSTSYNSVNVSWGSVTGASGYSLYRASSSTGSFSLVTRTTAKNYNNTDLTAGKTYYYKVRAYRIVGSSRVYGYCSSVASMKIAIVHVSSVSLDKSKDTLLLGDSDKLTVSISPEYATNQSVTWKSTDKTVATVDSKGNITSLGAGTATIVVTTADGNMTAECTIDVNKANIKGIDVSKWQGTINWSSVKSSGVAFAMLRATYGDGTSNYKNNGIDPMFQTNYTEAKANGIAVGAYHYSYAATADEAAIEADFYISQLAGKQFEYPVCVDLEDSSQSTLDEETLAEIALTYLKKLSQAGYYPMIYTNNYWLANKIDDTALSNYDHWVAEWGSSLSYTGMAGIWQYSSSGSVSGIAGNADMDISYVDYVSKIENLHLNGF